MVFLSTAGRPLHSLLSVQLYLSSLEMLASGATEVYLDGMLARGVVKTSNKHALLGCYSGIEFSAKVEWVTPELVSATTEVRYIVTVPREHASRSSLN